VLARYPHLAMLRVKNCQLRCETPSDPAICLRCYWSSFCCDLPLASNVLNAATPQALNFSGPGL
jgi:hypothetical protein